jgi:catechol 2,3-dioxygenase
MAPNLNGIDHVHVYVTDRVEAERWYRTVLGFERVEKFMVWATDTGPLTMEDASGTVHLALFEVDAPAGDTTIAFGATGEEFMAWKVHLEGRSLELRLSDHELAYSMYFRDPDQNMHEITTYDRDYVAARLVDDAR